MTIFTVQFDVDSTKTWTRLLNVFRASVKLHMPNVRFIERKIEKPEYTPQRPSNVRYNTEKLAVWNEYMQHADDNTIFMDCDMLCLRSDDNVFEQEFDIGMTFRPEGSHPPMNGGVVFARPSVQARKFFSDWLDVNNQMYADPSFHHKWRNRYLGMNQAAFGYMYESGMCDYIRRFKTRIWNAVNQDWKFIDDETVFVHMKSGMRTAIAQNVAPYGVYKRPLEEWYRIERQITGATKELISKKIG